MLKYNLLCVVFSSKFSEYYMNVYLYYFFQFTSFVIFESFKENKRVESNINKIMTSTLHKIIMF